MFFTVFFIYLVKSDHVDKFGVSFTNEHRIKLIKTPSTLEKYQIPEETEIIGGGENHNDKEKSAFYLSRNVITQIIFPENSKLRLIEAYGLAFLAKITEIDLSNCRDLLTISNGAFYKCVNVERFIFPPFLKRIDSGCLFALESITELNFPPTLQSIGGWTNYGGTIANCRRLNRISWGENPIINSIGGISFLLDNLTTFEIPASLVSIVPSALGYNSIKSIIVHKDNSFFRSDGMILYKGNSTLAYVSYVLTGKFVISDGITTIGGSAFIYSRITSVVIPSGLTSIQEDAFNSCSITNISIPSSVTQILYRSFGYSSINSIELNASINTLESDLFYSCSKLTRLIIPPTVNTIKSNVLYGCNILEYVFVPKSVTTILAGAFSGMSKSVVIEFDEDSPLRIANDTIFSSNYDSIIAYVGTSNSIDVFVRASVINIKRQAFKSFNVIRITFEENSILNEISDEAFMNTKMVDVSFPLSLKYIRTSAFESCSLLVSVYFRSMENLIEISDKAFKNTKLSSFSLPGSVEVLGDYSLSTPSLTNFVINGMCKLKTIGEGCFSKCSITSFSVQPSVEKLGEDLFADSKLQHLTFLDGSNSITNWTVGEASFRNCAELIEISFGSRIVAIGRNAFEDCKSLQNVTLSDSIELVSEYSFSGCSNLQTFSIGKQSKLKEIGTLAFDRCSLLKNFDVAGDNPSFESEYGALYKKGKIFIVAYLPASPAREYIVPGQVKEIFAYTFQNAVNLEVIKFERGISEDSKPIEKRIGYGAFKDCKNLRFVELPSFISEVGRMAFEGCTSLGCGSIVFEEKLKSDLQNSGASEIAMTPCPSATFTIVPSAPQIAGRVLVDPLISEEELMEIKE